MSRGMADKKRALQAHKEKLLEEIHYYDKRLEEFRSKGNESLLQDQYSSDSEDDFPVNIDNDPPMSQLKMEQADLKTRLQATQELTNLQVLQSEVKVLPTDPEIVGEPPIPEEGVWREVTAECRVDLVPFTISFYVHKPYRKFGALSYRGVRVTAVKAAHATELAKSVLAAVRHPSDAVEVLKSYSAAHRSRRTTLARLAEKYANSLFMEPMSDGGYTLKCAGLLEISWTLQNKSAVAPFQHRMRFDLEYMDESYIKTISHVHRQLSDPTISTDERTLLLTKIIHIVLEAKGPTQELYESMESDPDTASKLRKRRTTLDQRLEETIEKEIERNKDKEVMAPPKSLPKKVKKGKNNKTEGNNPGSETKDRIAENKDDDNKDGGTFVNSNNVINDSQKSIEPNKIKEVVQSGKVDNGKLVDAIASKIAGKDVTKPKNIENRNVNSKTVKAPKKRENSNEKGDNIDTDDVKKSKKINVEGKDRKSIKKAKKTDNLKEKENVAVTDNVINDGKIVKKPVKRVNSDGQVKNSTAKKAKSNNLLHDNKNNKDNKKIDTEITKNFGNNIRNDNANKKMAKVINNVVRSNLGVGKKPVNVKNTDTSTKSDTLQKVVEKNKIVPKKSNTADIVQKKIDNNVDNNKKNLNNLPKVIKKINYNIKSVHKKDKNLIVNDITKNGNPKAVNENTSVAIKNNDNNVLNKTVGNINKIRSDNIRSNIDKNLKKVLNENKLVASNKVLASVGNGVKNSKIPQKSKIASPGFLKNQLRISPRKTPSKFKTASIQKQNKMSAQKPGTSIPRLLKKPLAKS